ncbi:hypothetical protein BHE74_00027514 [Ensete ventricosum]|nr:hypothetical protein BHE74_00027514 [Ensete ventricosum]
MGRDCHACVASSLCVSRLGHQRGSPHCSWQRLHLPVSPSAVVFHKHYRGTAEQSRGGSEATAMHGSNIISSCIPWGREGRFSIEESSLCCRSLKKMGHENEEVSFAATAVKRG